MARKARIERKTKETLIKVELNLDGSGKAAVRTPLNFLNHMLESLAKHSGFDLKVSARGDVHVDDHHLVEDVGITLGHALVTALGDKKGIVRMAYFIAPMDDSKSTVAVDLSGRPYSVIDIGWSNFKDSRVGDVSKENIEHFLESFSVNGKFNLHMKTEGRNDHHKAEASFKALARALKEAVRVSGDAVPSTKGVL
ncbi:Imidazoleglycerol-phosphate dehydratase [uncultured archaeon]|nr:Imidazoleglycerol-phosphate dehydratase [uncultured archaeon]